MKEITNTELAEIRAASCSVLVQKLVARLDRVEGENASLQETAELFRNTAENYAAHIAKLRLRVIELTQCDPSWYDASPADAFMLLKKAQDERDEAYAKGQGDMREAAYEAADEKGNLLPWEILALPIKERP